MMKLKNLLPLLLAVLCLCLMLAACVKEDQTSDSKALATPTLADTQEDLETREYVDTNEDLDPSEIPTYEDSDEDLG